MDPYVYEKEMGAVQIPGTGRVGWVGCAHWLQAAPSTVTGTQFMASLLSCSILGLALSHSDPVQQQYVSFQDEFDHRPALEAFTAAG